ncbi:hypothetical protein IWQ60_011424 [Tieghemiomyces parasiticus]|uniref:Uncharacterized protein n=1 Tax=Tieghemiomyces parasiticus TaxID=78921 RepID=A0A9W8DMA7_9FUNG|nr:hypothetical protein IWQ60_011424 [Tieghemiomyces parasiticus]
MPDVPPAGRRGPTAEGSAIPTVNSHILQTIQRTRRDRSAAMTPAPAGEDGAAETSPTAERFTTVSLNSPAGPLALADPLSTGGIQSWVSVATSGVISLTASDVDSDSEEGSALTSPHRHPARGRHRHHRPQPPRHHPPPPQPQRLPLFPSLPPPQPRPSNAPVTTVMSPPPQPPLPSSTPEASLPVGPLATPAALEAELRASLTTILEPHNRRPALPPRRATADPMSSAPLPPPRQPTPAMTTAPSNLLDVPGDHGPSAPSPAPSICSENPAEFTAERPSPLAVMATISELTLPSTVSHPVAALSVSTPPSRSRGPATLLRQATSIPNLSALGTVARRDVHPVRQLYTSSWTARGVPLHVDAAVLLFSHRPEALVYMDRPKALTPPYDYYSAVVDRATRSTGDNHGHSVPLAFTAAHAAPAYPSTVATTEELVYATPPALAFTPAHLPLPSHPPLRLHDGTARAADLYSRPGTSAAPSRESLPYGISTPADSPVSNEAPLPTNMSESPTAPYTTATLGSLALSSIGVSLGSSCHALLLQDTTDFATPTPIPRPTTAASTRPIRLSQRSSRRSGIAATPDPTRSPRPPSVPSGRRPGRRSSRYPRPLRSLWTALIACTTFCLGIGVGLWWGKPPPPEPDVFCTLKRLMSDLFVL